MKLSARFVFSMSLITAFAWFPVMGSEAQSADMSAKQLSCGALQQMSWEEMDVRQKDYSARCDAGEADRAWQEAYGLMNEQVWASAAVYE